MPTLAGRRHLPQNLLGNAIDYAPGQWRTLNVYLDDGRVEIDNNLVESAIRPRLWARRTGCSWARPKRGERGAVLYTVIEITTTVEPFENGRSFSLRVHRAG